MIKKNSWIVALLLALSFTTFFSCVEAYVDPDAPTNETLTLVAELGDFNNFAGGGVNQQGWATDGHSEAKTKEGYKAEDWKQAKYLIIKVKDDAPALGNLKITWGGEPRGALAVSNPGWIQNEIMNDQGVPQPGKGVTLSADKKEIKIELKKALGNSFYFFDEAVTELKIVLEYYSPDVPSLVDSAAFWKSDEVVPFVPVTNISGPPSLINKGDEVKLEPATITPDDATKQKIIWSIVGFLPKGDTTWKVITGKPDGTTAEKDQYDTSKSALLSYVDFAEDRNSPLIPAQTYWDYSVYPPEEKEIPGTGMSANLFNKKTDTIKAATVGKVRIQALIVGGDVDEEDYKQIFTIQVESETSPESIDLSSVNAVGGTLTNVSSTSFTLTYPNGQGYGNVYATFSVNFGTGNSLADVANIIFDIEGLAGDITWKSALLIVTNDEKTSYISQDDLAIATVTNALNATGAAATGLKIPISESMVTVGENDNQNVYMIIMIAAGDAGGTTSYKISNVKYTLWEK